MSRRVERWVISLAGLLAIFIVAAPAHCQSCVTQSQVTLTGNLRSANGLPSSNSIITLTPSQTGFIAGCGVNLPQATTCSTSTDGSVVQTPNPLTTTINTTSGSGSLTSGTYYTVYEWYDALGHTTLPSPETRTILSASGSLVVNPPTSGVPSTAVGMDVFIGTTSGGETLQGQTTGTSSFTQSTPLTSGTSPSMANNTVCVVTANDSIWPTGTGYIATMTDSVGNAIPGFPMQWQLMGAGSTINLSNGLPYYHGVVTYPVPVLTMPQNHGVQSISGPLNMTGYNIINVGKLGVGTSTPGYSIDVTNGLINSDQGYLVNGNGGTVNECLASDGTAYDTEVACVTSLPSLFYQTVLNGSHTSDAVTQRSYFAIGTGTGLVANDEIGVGGQVSRTVVSLNTYPTISTLNTDPYAVVTAGGATNGQFACWDGTTGGITGSTAACGGVGQDEYSSIVGCNLANDGGGLTCTPGDIVWPVGFPDTAYTATCTINYSAAIAGGSSTQPVIILNWQPTSVTHMVITEGVAQGSSGGYIVAPNYGVTIYCHGHHT